MAIENGTNEKNEDGFVIPEYLKNSSKNRKHEGPRNHASVGVYSNGEYIVNIVRDEHLQSHIEYNTTFRFGRGLFIDGKCVYRGYLSEEKAKEWEEKIAEMNIDITKASDMYY